MIEATAPLGYVAHGEAASYAPSGCRHPNGILALRLRGSIDMEVLQRTFDAMLLRHRVLREGRAQQDACVSVMRQDSTDTANALAEPAWIEVVIREQVERAFESTDVLLRACLLRLDGHHAQHQDAVLLFVLDPIVADEWSIALLHYEFMALYEAFHAGGADPFPPLSMQYADCTDLQRAKSGQGEHDDALAYWLSRFTGYAPVQKARTGEQPMPGSCWPATAFDEPLDASLRKRLVAVARAYRTSLFTLLHAALAVLLHRYGGQGDILIGVPVSGRREIEFEPVVGRFAKLLLLRTRLADDMFFDEVLRIGHGEISGAYRHQDVSFNTLLERWHETHPQAAPLVAHAQFSMCESPQAYADLPGLQVAVMESPCHYAFSPLELRVCDTPTTFSLRWTFAMDLLEHDVVKAMSAEFLCLLEGIACHPARPIAALNQPVGLHVSDAPGPFLGGYASTLSRTSAAPSTPTERALARIWADNLRMREELIGVTDSYFDIGGDSLRTITLTAAIRDTMQVKVSIADIFSYPTIQKLARHLAGGDVQPPTHRTESASSKNRIMRARKHMTT